MKSRTSFFNPTVFRKDLTRFAPTWGIYTVVLLLGYAVIMAETTAYYRANSVADLTAVMALVNFGYAFLNVQLLFGDLFSARMCNALHAMPMRRECWYGTHLVSGFAFSIVPNVLLAVLGLVTMNLGAAWSVPLYWLLASTLEYLCFFGIAVLCVMLTGNRFAATVVYGLVNFFSVLVYWLVESLYAPLLTGLRIRTEPFLCGSPVVRIMQDYDLVEILRERITDEFGDYLGWNITGIALGGSWIWLAVYAAVGAMFLGLGLALYRRRALECAGDFMAFKATEPVLLIVYTVTVGGIFHLFSELMGSGVEKYIFLIVGLAVGYFTGLMLLQRTVRVFRLKAVAGYAVFTAALLLSLGLTALDPIGITRWVPEAEKVESVTLSNRYNYNGWTEGEMVLTDNADIQAILDIHEYSIGRDANKEFAEFGANYSVNVCIEYTLKNGRVRTRFYDVNALNEAGVALNRYFSSFEYVTGYTEDQIPQLSGTVFTINTPIEKGREEYIALDYEEMLRCIARDCAEGHMAQNGSYHLEENELGMLDWNRSTYLEFGYRIPTDLVGGWSEEYVYLGIYPDAVHTLKWMEDNGLYTPGEDQFG